MTDHSDRSRYFDYAATSPLDSRVLREMLPYFGEDFGNAHSIHSFGRKARAAVEHAREQVAQLLGAEDPSQILFTSGATESNNQVLSAFQNGCMGPFEHSAVREPGIRRGLSTLNNNGLEVLPPAEPVELISQMLINNEIGTIWDPTLLRASCEYLHSDITQALGKIPIDLSNISFASFSAHKFYGPKGVGGLYSEALPLHSFILGGEQEYGYRGGTLNVPGIVGMGAAAEIAIDEQAGDFDHASTLRELCLSELEGFTDWQVNGGPTVSPFILSLSFLGVEGESIVIELDRMGFAVSSGAACSSQSQEPSHVLTALNMSEAWLRGTVRVSFGRGCSLDSTAVLSKSLRLAVEKLRSMN